MNKTPNYALNQWEATDQVQRTDFNADNAKIDAALEAVAEAVAAAPKVAAGSYTGDGAESRFIDVGFTPKAVFVCSHMGETVRNSSGIACFGGLAVTGAPVYAYDAAHPAVQIVAGGFKVFKNDVRIENRSCSSVTNNDTYKFRYIAIG